MRLQALEESSKTLDKEVSVIENETLTLNNTTAMLVGMVDSLRDETQQLRKQLAEQTAKAEQAIEKLRQKNKKRKRECKMVTKEQEKRCIMRPPSPMTERIMSTMGQGS